jgi:hypothetical protein
MIGDVEVHTVQEVDIYVDIDAEDFLSRISDEDLIDYVVNELDNNEIREKLGEKEQTDYNKFSDTDELMEYLVDEYHRDSFSDFPFDKFFEKINVKLCKCPKH